MADLVINKLNPQQFFTQINEIVANLKCDYIDAVCLYCEKNNIEIETAASMIKGNMKIKSHLQLEGEQLNMLPKTSKLPL